MSSSRRFRWSNANLRPCWMWACPILRWDRAQRLYPAARRIKLSRELSKRDTGSTLYILDEPTTGLHFHDIKQLLAVLHRLRDHNNTIIVIEHNLDVIKTADWIVELGPEGGDGGGDIVAVGTPEEIADHSISYTGRYLKPVLGKTGDLKRKIG